MSHRVLETRRVLVPWIAGLAGLASSGCFGGDDLGACTPEPPDMVALGTLDGAAFYDDDCPDRPDAEAVVVAGVRLCPDAQVLDADWPTYPSHVWVGGAGGSSEPPVDLAAFATRVDTDTAATGVAGFAWSLIDADLPRATAVVASGSGGVARTQADDPSAPVDGAPMTPETYGLIGSVSKFVSTVFFLRLLEEIAEDDTRNPAGLTVPQLVELPAYHFLPGDWKACIDNAGCGVALSSGEDADSQNDSFKTVRMRDLMAHTSGIGVQGSTYGTERLWGYMVTGTSKYDLDGDAEPNNTQGVYDYENVNIRFLAALFYGLDDPMGRAGQARIWTCDDGSGDGETVEEAQDDFEPWSVAVLDEMIVSMHDTIRDLRAIAGTDFVYSCDVPADVDIDGDPIPSGVAYIYTLPDGDPLDAGAWFSSEQQYGGCPPQGSFWTSTEELAGLLWDIQNGFFDDDRMLPMITAYESPARRLIFDNPVASPWMESALDYNNGDVHWKGGDQPVSSVWTFVDSGENLEGGSGTYPNKSGHAAVVFLPFGYAAVSMVNSGGMVSPTQANLLKNAMIDGLIAGSPPMTYPDP